MTDLTDSLADFLVVYSLEHSLAPTTQVTMRWAIRHFGRYLGHDPQIADFCSDRFNRYLAATEASGMKMATVRGLRTNLLVLWRSLAEDGVAATPTKVRKVKVPASIPTAWTAAEMRTLLEVAKQFQVRLRRSKANTADVLRALILAAWDTGLRIGDLRRISIDSISHDGIVVLSQSKTGWPIVCRLRPATIKALKVVARYAANRPPLSIVGKRHLCRLLGRAVKKAGLKGGTRKIRKSGATAVEAVTPGAAMAFLGHRTPGLAVRHYIDPRIIQQTKPLPPSLTD